ncbi:MAG: sigma-E factor negative regulatory protein [Marinobacter sp.]|uniref:sigma-E factor negative regulatory protein n=1 Tax=Marinobacter sp. TaxID=50741 RepID=UPI001B615B49|nr:RseA family anti-sigma factor [Marinobacter sp.]MBQ0746914.1 sigma-E factor negative regulatory protein [Marinobacter sp.]MBQ0813880.1 sigma-E factor negative regulatory protein [Marinobacter sp.]|tara:strand:- start:341 stop:931 length:591 start_codon:yes stop_codon:yes gene_type:complete
MDDRLRETLSAMMDDEADELSVRRLLCHEGQDDVRAQWQRWQGIHDLMHRGHSPAEGVDVSVAVREVLDGRIRSQVLAVSDSREAPRRWQWPAVAMVAVALLVGFGAGAGWDAGETSPSALASAPVTEVQAPDAESAGAVSAGERAPVQEVALQGLDEKQWEHMSRYLLEHAQHNSVGAGQGSVGYARLVSANGGY